MSRSPYLLILSGAVLLSGCSAARVAYVVTPEEASGRTDASAAEALRRSPTDAPQPPAVPPAETDTWDRRRGEGFSAAYRLMVRGRFAEAEAALAGLIGQAENAGAAEGTDELLFWLAHCREQQGRRREAAATYRAMLKRYPQSPFAADARERAEALEAERSP